MKELMLRIMRAMVDHPEAVAVSDISGDQMSVFERDGAKEDLGKVIGKQGRNAKAIRTILNAASSRDRRRAVLEMIDNEKEKKARSSIHVVDVGGCFLLAGFLTVRGCSSSDQIDTGTTAQTEEAWS